MCLLALGEARPGLDVLLGIGGGGGRGRPPVAHPIDSQFPRRAHRFKEEARRGGNMF